MKMARGGKSGVEVSTPLFLDASRSNELQVELTSNDDQEHAHEGGSKTQ